MLGYNKTEKLEKCYQFKKTNFWSENTLFKKTIYCTILKKLKYARKYRIVKMPNETISKKSIINNKLHLLAFFWRTNY